MSQGNFEACLAVTLPHEGGWSDHPKDPGGATMKGITLETFRRWRPGASKQDLRAISDADVASIYRAGYWNAVRGDRLPAGVDLATFDAGVNSGPGRAARWLQASAGASVDGVIGENTLARVGAKTPGDLVKALCARRLGFLKGLSTFTTFGKGWSRRVADVEAKGVAMALRSAGATADAVAVSMMAEAGAARGLSVKRDKGATATATGGIGGGLATPMTGADLDLWLIGAVSLALLLVAIVVKSRARIHSERAAAYSAVAGGAT